MLIGRRNPAGLKGGDRDVVAEGVLEYTHFPPRFEENLVES
jgi:hypothetical protein